MCRGAWFFLEVSDFEIKNCEPFFYNYVNENHTTEDLCDVCKQAVGRWYCSACKNRLYCSTACQRRDWPDHISQCIIVCMKPKQWIGKEISLKPTISWKLKNWSPQSGVYSSVRMNSIFGYTLIFFVDLKNTIEPAIWKLIAEDIFFNEIKTMQQNKKWMLYSSLYHALLLAQNDAITSMIGVVPSVGRFAGRIYILSRIIFKDDEMLIPHFINDNNIKEKIYPVRKEKYNPKSQILSYEITHTSNKFSTAIITSQKIIFGPISIKKQ